MFGMQMGRMGQTGATVTSDPHYANVSLLLHCDGADGSTTFTDSSAAPKNVTAFGNAKISTAQSVFGGASAAFDGAGDYLVAADALDWSFLHNNTNSFTLEVAVYWDGASADLIIMSTAAASADVGAIFGINGAAGRVASFQRFRGVSGAIQRWTSTTGVVNAGWSRIAFVFNSDTGIGSFFINGVSAGSGLPTTSGSWSPSAAPPTYTLAIGRYQYSTPGGYFKGFLDELRITKGVARYTADFTPPTAPY